MKAVKATCANDARVLKSAVFALPRTGFAAYFFLIFSLRLWLPYDFLLRESARS
jgi:hypothetical protein